MIKATSSAVYTPACLQNRKINIKLYVKQSYIGYIKTEIIRMCVLPLAAVMTCVYIYQFKHFT